MISTTFVGDTPIVVTRDQEGSLHAFVNRCAHRGALVCRELRGNRATHVCVYHQWSYGLQGNPIGVPFRKGIEGKGEYAADFSPTQHSLHKLKVATYDGLIFASFAENVEPLDEYIGPPMRPWLDKIFHRPVRVLGYVRQLINSNWKLYAENVRDPYHGSGPVEAVLPQADCIIVAGANAPWHPPLLDLKDGCKVIVFEEDPLRPRAPYWGYLTDHCVAGDIGMNLAQLYSHLKERRMSSPTGRTEYWSRYNRQSGEQARAD